MSLHLITATDNIKYNLDMKYLFDYKIEYFPVEGTDVGMGKIS